jgi:hypothetical protein
MHIPNIIYKFRLQGSVVCLRMEEGCYGSDDDLWVNQSSKDLQIRKCRFSASISFAISANNSQQVKRNSLEITGPSASRFVGENHRYPSNLLCSSAAPAILPNHDRGCRRGLNFICQDLRFCPSFTTFALLSIVEIPSFCPTQFSSPQSCGALPTS